MPTYPTFGQEQSSIESPVETVISELGNNNKLRKVSYFTNVGRIFSVIHTLDTTDRNTLDTFYFDNYRNTFDFTWAGDSSMYTCMFTSPPQYSMMGPGYWSVTTNMVKV